MMKVQPPGFLRPVQSAPLEKSQEDAIAAVCPGLGQRVEAKGRSDSVLWGPHKGMSIGWARDPEVRFAGASGGALSAVLIYLLESGTVDAVVQTTAASDHALGNAPVITLDAAGVTAAAGSRYAPSSPLATLPELIADHASTGRRFAFVGKPCDAAALRAMSERDLAVTAAFPIILSFFCAGVPSYRGGEAVLAALETDVESTASFRFRGNGWPGRATATAHDGSERSMSYHDSWGGILSNHVQHRCKICADGTGVAADIVCADAWETDAAGYPVFEDAPGVSLIVTRTALGAELVKAAEAAGYLKTAAFDPGSVETIQPGQRERRRALLARLLALRLAGRPIPRYEGLQIIAAARQNPFSRNLKNFLGTLRRILLPNRR